MVRAIRRVAPARRPHARRTLANLKRVLALVIGLLACHTAHLWASTTHALPIAELALIASEASGESPWAERTVLAVGGVAPARRPLARCHRRWTFVGIVVSIAACHLAHLRASASHALHHAELVLVASKAPGESFRAERTVRAIRRVAPARRPHARRALANLKRVLALVIGLLACHTAHLWASTTHAPTPAELALIASEASGESPRAERTVLAVVGVAPARRPLARCHRR